MLRRLGDRSDSGVSFFEYVALGVLAAVIVATVVVAGLGSTLSASVGTVVCRVTGGANCGASKTAGQHPGQDTGDQNGGGDNGDNGNGNKNGKPPTLAELEKNADDAQRAADNASGGKGHLLNELFDIVKEFIGWNDLMRCINDGDFVSCLMTFINAAALFVGIFKIFKIGKIIDKAVKLFKDIKESIKVVERTANAAKRAKEALVNGIRRARQLCKGKNSFDAGTPVLLASGRRRPIQDIRVGDLVIATDPVSGVTRAEPVQRLIRGHRNERLVTLTVATDPYGLNSDVLTATTGHKFWSASRHAWTDAGDLRPSDRLVAPGGGTTRVIGRHVYWRTQTAYNLTIADLHTYYVGSGATTALVHNEPEDDVCDAAFDGAGHIYDEIKAGNKNHQIPGIGSTEADIPKIERYLDDVMKRPPNFVARGGPKQGQEFFYDEGKQYLVIKKNSYSATGRRMTPDEWKKFLANRQKEADG